VTAFFGSSALEFSYEAPEVHHGVFSFYVLQGLRGAADTKGNGRVTLAELERLVRECVPGHVRQSYKRGQHPELLGAPKRDDRCDRQGTGHGRLHAAGSMGKA